jgi:hypothetical protein
MSDSDLPPIPPAATVPPTPTPTPTPPNPPAARRPRGLQIALALSLMANLAVAGVVAGAVMRHDRDGMRGTAISDSGLGIFLDAMSPRDRRALGRDLVQNAPAFRQNRAALREAFDRFLAALRADPFDPQALRVAAEGQQAMLRDRQDIGRDLLIARIEAMSPAERARFADALDRALRHGARPPIPAND